MTKPPRIPPMPNNSMSIESAIRRNQVPVDLVWNPDEPLEVNSCSGHSEMHTQTCDSNCAKQTLDEYDVLIENERREWARVGMAIENYRPNMIHVHAQIQTLIQIIQEKFDISDEQFNDRFKPNMLERMKETRLIFQEQIKAANTRSNIIVPGLDPTKLQ